MTSELASIDESRANGTRNITSERANGGTGDLTRERVWKRRDECIERGFRRNAPVLIEGFPSTGKSYGIIKWAAATGNPLSIFAPRHELFDQYLEWCEDHDLRALKLPTFHENCATARGDHGEEWEDRVGSEYRKSGLLPGELHKQAETLFGEPLPCQREGRCSYFAARDFDPEEYDVLVGHYQHAYVPERIENRFVAFDEFPNESFLSEYRAETVTKAVGNYLDRHTDLPFDYLKDLKEFGRDPERRREGIEWFRRHNPELVRDVVSAIEDRTGGAHPEAAAMTYAILVANDLENRWEYARLPDGRTAVLNPKDESLTVLNRPSLENAESVVALDGTPTIAKWKLMLGDTLQHIALLTDEEKRAYLRDTLGLRIIQTTVAANHYSGRSTISVTEEKDLALFEAVARRETCRPTLISSRSALALYEEYGLSEIIGETKHYGDLKGSNEFDTVHVGIVAGSPHYGDDYIKKWAGLLGESVSRAEGTKGMDQDFGPIGNQILRGMRENGVLQAIMRFGRDGGGATVYVHTAALPQWVDRAEGIPEIHLWKGRKGGVRSVTNAISELDKAEWRTKEVAERVPVSDQQVRNHLHTLAELGYISYRREGRGYIWTDESLETIGRYGHVEFTKSSI